MKEQLLSIDRMKVTANYMRCMIHCLVPYMVYNHGMWFFQAEPRMKGVDVLVFILHSFVMELFILLSGYLTYSAFTPWKKLFFTQWKRIINPWFKAALFTIPLLYASKGLYIEYIEPGSASFSLTPILNKSFSLFKADVKEHGFPIVHYWYLFHLLIYTIAANVFKKWPLPVALGFIIVGLAINKEGMIRNPIYLEIKWPALYYYFGFFLLGRWFRQQNITDFSFKLNSIWSFLLFILHLALFGWYLDAYNLKKIMPLSEWLLPYSLGATALFGCSWFSQIMNRANWQPTAFLTNINFKFYLYHLPVAMMFQLFFIAIGATAVWVPLAVFVLSTGTILSILKLNGIRRS